MPHWQLDRVADSYIVMTNRLPLLLVVACIVLASGGVAGCSADRPTEARDGGAVGPGDVALPDTDVGPNDATDFVDDSTLATDVVASEPACVQNSTGAWIVTRFEFLATNPDGTVDGYDLDGIISDGSDAEGCGKLDAVSSAGLAGIDNQLAVLLPALEATGVSLQTLIGARIREGQLMLIARLDGSVTDCDAIRFGRGDGEVLFGADGRTLAYQTVELYDGAVESTSTSCESNGECGLSAAGDELTIEFTFITQDIRIDVSTWQGDFDIADDGTLTGMVGGAVALDGVMDIVEGLGGCGDEPIREVLEPLLPNFADVFPDDDGQCTGISVAVRIEALPIYLFDE